MTYEPCLKWKLQNAAWNLLGLIIFVLFLSAVGWALKAYFNFCMENPEVYENQKRRILFGENTVFVREERK